MNYYRVKIGFDQFVSIDETELETALLAFMTDSKAVFRNGAVRGKDIMAIVEDWHKAMGYNENYRITPEDWTDIKREVGNIYDGCIAEAKSNINTLLSMNRSELIGKPGTLEERLNLLENK